MDELIKALSEMENVLNDYVTSLAEDVETIKSIKNDTNSNLGNDSLGVKTTSLLAPLETKLAGAVEEAAKLARDVTRKKEELIKVIEKLK